MKKIVDAATVAHLWANKVQDEAYTANRNMFFNNEIIYSYGRHFVIAKFVKNDAGKEVVLFSDRTYSNTTSKQQGLVRNATRHLDLIHVPDADDNKYKNFESWLSEIKRIAANLKNARKPEKYLLQIKQVFNTVKIYADFFGYDIPESILEFTKIGNGAEYAEALKKEAELKAIADAKRAQKAKIEFNKTLKKWRNNEFTGYFTNNTGFDYLRFNADKNRVETSQKVDIPGEAAKRFYATVLEVIKKGGCTNCNMRFMDMYDVKEINKNFIQIGCHKIEIKEIKELTNKLGW